MWKTDDRERLRSSWVILVGVAAGTIIAALLTGFFTGCASPIDARGEPTAQQVTCAHLTDDAQWAQCELLRSALD